MAVVPVTSDTAADRVARLRITEIFLSLQGESSYVGWPTVFVRLTGCPLRCGYCDTAYAFHGGRMMNLEQILETVTAFEVRHVCVTGGEPLAQKSCAGLLQQLCERGYIVSLETSGALDIGGLDPRVSRVLDIKTPGSGEAERNRWDNLEMLTSHDQVKFVLCDRRDYDWACRILNEHRLSQRCEVLFSPVYQRVMPRELADWIIQDRLPVRMQLQLHKLLWGEQAGR